MLENAGSFKPLWLIVSPVQLKRWNRATVNSSFSLSCSLFLMKQDHASVEHALFPYQSKENPFDETEQSCLKQQWQHRSHATITVYKDAETSGRHRIRLPPAVILSFGKIIIASCVPTTERSSHGSTVLCQAASSILRV